MKKEENCKHCGEEFIPKRKGTQIFCSNSCRSRYWYLNNSEINKTPPLDQLKEAFEEKNKKTKIEKMSMSGIGNAALGTMAANAATALATKIFIPNDNKAATKGDIQELKKLINTRYFEVHNISPDPYGKKAYFDMSMSKIVYFDESQKTFELPPFDL